MKNLISDNIEDLVENGVVVIGVHNTTRTRYYDEDKVKNVLERLEINFPSLTFILMDSNISPKSTKRIAPDGIEYFPLFYVIKDGEVEDIYFGVSVEKLTEIIKTHL